ncbi:MAG: hypothetical protein WCK08_09080 [Betaproteobacteria bacterium]
MSEFLGPHGKATIILIRSHFDSELPRLKDLKKLLHIPDGRYYKSAGRSSHQIFKIERLLAILRNIRGEEVDWRKIKSTDYLITVAEVHSNLFMALKYAAQVIEGFNLTDAALTDLEARINAYAFIAGMRSDITRMVEVLSRNSESAVEKGFKDLTILNPNIPALQEILAGYGDAQFAQICRDIEDWYETYRWKVQAPLSSKGADKDDQTADAAVI